MPNEEMSLVKALQDYFSKQPNGKKIETSEFKQLTQDDKRDFYHMLTNEGYNIVLSPEQKQYIK